MIFNENAHFEKFTGNLLLENKVVVITGGAGLLGKEFAKAIVVHGGKPVLADIRGDAAWLVAQELNEEFGKASAFSVEMDITSKASIQSAISEVYSSAGHIDALVNSAYPRNRNYGRKFKDVEFSDFCENVNLHLGGYFLASQQFAIFFQEQGGGNIVTLSSIYGVVAPRFDIYEGTDMTMPVEYAAIKSALIHLAAYMLRYFQGSGIRFNCLSPGGIADAQPNTFIDKYTKYANSKGMLTPKDITGALVFLLSDYSRYINGQNIVVDDGWSV
jgi:NAD(P)-dependent dehydrogenase (short-subunit alcohol dehydrogenase family)